MNQIKELYVLMKPDKSDHMPEEIRDEFNRDYEFDNDNNES